MHGSSLLAVRFGGEIPYHEVLMHAINIQTVVLSVKTSQLKAVPHSFGSLGVWSMQASHG